MYKDFLVFQQILNTFNLNNSLMAQRWGFPIITPLWEIGIDFSQ